MLDIAPKIANLLNDIAPVELAGSEKELEMPCIYIEQVTNSADVTFDCMDFLTGFSYQIDIYAETPKRCIEIAEAVDAVMQNNGWYRSNGLPMGRQRYVLTYQCEMDEKYNTYKE